MKKEQLTIQIKNGREWETSNIITDKETIHRYLSHDLIAKKLHSCKYITSIRDRTNYDGTRTIIVSYTDGVRRIYIIEF